MFDTNNQSVCLQVIVRTFTVDSPMVEIEIILHVFEGFLHVLLVGVRGHVIVYFSGVYVDLTTLADRN